MNDWSYAARTKVCQDDLWMMNQDDYGLFNILSWLLLHKATRTSFSIIGVQTRYCWMWQKKCFWTSLLGFFMWIGLNRLKIRYTDRLLYWWCWVFWCAYQRFQLIEIRLLFLYSKVYVQFGRSHYQEVDERRFHARIPGRVSMAVYRAVKLRQLKIPCILHLLKWVICQ